MLKRRRVLQGMLAMPFFMVMGGCEKGAPTVAQSFKPVPLESGDECAVCGMLIREFPGPKAEVAAAKGQVLKFCSTRDLMTWWLQPENRHLQVQAYVHDMAQNDWQHPDDQRFIDARKAWYVIGSDLPGAMGPTLASFAEDAAARQFIDKHGGRLLTFGEIDLDVLGTMQAGMEG